MPAATAGCPVGGGEGVDRLVGVEPARVGHDPQHGAAERLRLAAGDGVAVAEGVAVGGDAGDGHDHRAVLGDERDAAARRRRAARPSSSSDALAVARATRLVMPMPRSMRYGAVVVGHADAAIDVPVDHAGPPQRRVEAVAGVGEVRRRRRRPQAGVDADEEQPQARADEVGHRCVAERLQLGPGEPHAGTLRARGDASGAGRRDTMPATMPSAGGRPPRCRRCNRCRPLRRPRRRSSGHVQRHCAARGARRRARRRRPPRRGRPRQRPHARR